MVSSFCHVDKHSDNPLIRGWPGENLLVAKKTKNWLQQVHFQIALHWLLDHWVMPTLAGSCHFTAKMIASLECPTLLLPVLVCGPVGCLNRSTWSHATHLSFPAWLSGSLVVRGPNLFFKYLFFEFGMTLIWPTLGDLPRSNFFERLRAPRSLIMSQKGNSEVSYLKCWVLYDG